MKKKVSVLMCVAMVCALLAGCGEKESLQNEIQTEIELMQDTQIPVENQETEQDGKTEADTLLDQFLAGEIDADRNGLYGEGTFNISDLQMDVEDWASYSVGERLDLDNDGENEQILNGPYGGIYLDASDDKVKVLACGEGTARNLFYINIDGEVWIAYSDTTHVGRACYFFEKYYGADDLAETISLQRFKEDDCVTYYLNDREVSYSIYVEEYEKFFGTFEGSDVVGDREILDEGSSTTELYEVFLSNEISVANPYVEGDMLSVMSDEDYDGEFDGAQKSYAFVDVNGDKQEELIFKITAYPSELMMILGVYNDELICFDVMETHTLSMGFGAYDNGLVWWGQNYDGEENVFYTYTNDGAPREIIHFVKENEMTDEENTYDYYYFDGNVEEKIYLQSYDEYESIVSAYEGEWLEWKDLSSFTGL